MKKLLKRISEAINQFCEDFFQSLPTETELRDNFPHVQSCVPDLEAEHMDSYMTFPDTWVSLSLKHTEHYLHCRHCGVRAEYREVTE